MMWGIVLAALVAPAMAAPPTDAAETVQLKDKAAVVYGEGGIPMFKADREFILAFAGNADGKVFKFDSSKRRVRISSEGSGEVWLACDELQPTASCTDIAAAAAPAAPKTRGRLSRGGGIPNCPGDPRCPRLNSK